MTEVPNDIQIERAVLCCVMLKPELIRSCDFTSRAFFSEFHRTVYSILSDLDENGAGADPVLLARRFREMGADRSAEIGRIEEAQASTLRFEWYKRELLRIAYNRSVVEIAEKETLMAQQGDEPDAIEETRLRLMRRAQEDFQAEDLSMDFAHVETQVRRFYQRLDVDAVSLGYPDLDRVVGDLYPGMVLTVLARPGIGKSMLGLNIVHSWLRLPAAWACMFASLEMGDTLAGARLMRIVDGWTKAEITEAMRTGGVPVETRKLTLDRLAMFTRARQPIDAIEAAIGSWERSHDRKVRCLVIDYFQYLRGEKNESPYERGSRLSREVKELAKQRNLVILNLCQVKRGDEGGKGSECPTLESARDSGTIEENADVVVGMWQPKAKHEVAFRGLKVREGQSGLQANLLHDVETGRMFTHYHRLAEGEE